MNIRPAQQGDEPVVGNRRGDPGAAEARNQMGFDAGHRPAIEPSENEPPQNFGRWMVRVRHCHGHQIRHIVAGGIPADTEESVPGARSFHDFSEFPDQPRRGLS